MGVWSANFWDNDVALDTRESFKEYFKYGLTDDEGLTSVMRYCPEINDPDDGPVATIVIALQLWKMGRLSSLWLQKAKQASEVLLKNMKDEFDEGNFNKYKKSLLKIIGQITSPQPLPKEIKRIPPFKNIWQPGDVLVIKAPKSISVAPCIGKYKRDVGRSVIIKKWYIIFLIESINDNIITGYTRFNNTISSPEHIKDINEIPYIDKYEMHMLREVRAKEYILIGNINDSKNNENSILKNLSMPCYSLKSKQPFSTLYERVPISTAEKYFRDYENKWPIEL